MSKVLTDQIEKRTGGTAIDVPAGGKWPQGNIADDAIGASQIAADAVGTSELSATGTASATTFLRGDNSWQAVDTSGIDANKEDIALLAFKTQANGSLARYNLVDQSVDAFEDTSGIDTSASTGEIRNSVGKYYSGKSSVPTGGTITTYSSGGTDYFVHTFLASGDFVTFADGNVDYLLVAGGGAGGGYAIGGGGGAGGYLTAAGLATTTGTYPIVIGAGGIADNSAHAPARPGGDTTGFSLTAIGGGGAGNGTGGAAGAGGSGGGANGYSGAGGAGTAGPPRQGYNGGATASPSHGGGGGGGASEVGESPPQGHGGDGGDGIQNAYRTGSNVYYAGGGGGSGHTDPGGTGGQGGGGAGKSPPATAGNPATVNTGGGAGGGDTGGTGGSGIAIIRFADGSLNPNADMSLESNTITAQTAPTKADLVFTYTNGVGTSVVGTNITAEASMDAGSTWTNFSIAAGDVQGTTGGHTIVTKNNVTLTSTSGTSMRYRIKTLVQGVAMESRIHAVSLGWS